MPHLNTILIKFKRLFNRDEQLDENIQKEVEGPQPEVEKQEVKESKKRKKRNKQATSVDPKLASEENSTENEVKKEESAIASKPESKTDLPKVNVNKRKLDDGSVTTSPNKSTKRKKQKTVTSQPELKSDKAQVEKKAKSIGQKGVKTEKKSFKQNNKNSQVKNPLRKDRRPENRTKTQEPLSDISENRLRAFGINPKRFFNKLKYGPNSQQSKKVPENGKQKKIINKKKGQKSGKTTATVS